MKIKWNNAIPVCDTKEQIMTAFSKCRWHHMPKRLLKKSMRKKKCRKTQPCTRIKRKERNKTKKKKIISRAPIVYSDTDGK